MENRASLSVPMRTHPRALVCGSRAAERIEAALAWLDCRGATEPVVIVASSAAAAAELVGRAAERRQTLGGPSVLLGWRRFTLARLASTVGAHHLAAAGLVLVGPASLEALSSRALFDLPPERRGRLGALWGRPGLPRALARTLGELRAAGIDGSQIADEALRALLNGYEAALASSRLIDAPGVLASATRAIAERRGPDELVGAPLLFLDVPIESRVAHDFAVALAHRAPTVLATVPAGDSRALRTWSEASMVLVDLDALRPEPKPEPKPEPEPDLEPGSHAAAARAHPAEGSGLRRLQRGLFSSATTEGPASEDVVLFSAPDESRECVEIARLVHREAERGVRFDEMAVVLRLTQTYLGHLEDALRRAGIPAHFAGGVRRADPAGRALLALLACAAERLSAGRFVEYLSLAELPIGQSAGDGEEDEAASTRDVLRQQAWERLLIEAAVIAGRPRWERRLEHLTAQKRAELASLEGQIGDAVGREKADAAQGRLRADLAALMELRAYAWPLLDHLEPLASLSTNWGEWVERLAAMAVASLRAPERVLCVLAELAPMAPVGPVDLTDVRILLEKRLTEVLAEPEGRRSGRLFVGAVQDLRGLGFEVVFVPGMAERLFPQKVTEDPLLPDRERGVYGGALITNTDRTAEERLMLRIAVGAANTRVVVSYPRIDLEQSRPRTPSFYALEVLRAAEGKLPGFAELAHRAERVAGARLGWPAPKAPHQAIDSAEHDLALLDSILHRPERETVGMARYLLSCNVHLARALRFRARRWIRAWTKADGLVDPCPEAQEALAAHALSARAYSPTALQQFAACPYRFVLQAIHKLSVREEPEPLEDLDPLQRGSLIHEVQFEFLSEMRSDGRLPIRPDQLAEAQQRLDRVLERVADGHREVLAPSIERVWRDALDTIRADLGEWLRRTSEAPDWAPHLFELSFGLPGRRDQDPASVDQPVVLDCGIRLRGSIDLVERSATGLLRATDHKSGKARHADGTVIGGGEALQPVLYALVLEKLFPEARVEAGRLYYCTSAGEYATATIPLDGAARRAADLVARTVGGALSSGFLPAAPAQGACEYCDYAVVCGPYEELRCSRVKRQDALQPLTELRKTS